MKASSSFPWAKQFQIQSKVDLDFVIGQDVGFPVGMQRKSPPEFRRRVIAAMASYRLQLSSIDYTLKRYVASDKGEHDDVSLGDRVSDYLRDSVTVLMTQLRSLHTEYPAFGVFGAEITLFRVPHSIDTARMLSNRGLLLEVLPILRLCLEMIAWTSVAFYMSNEDEVVALKAHSCISQLKSVYETSGKIYGYLSTFSHWGHVVHGEFLEFEQEGVAVLQASVRYRAMALALCLVILDLLVEVARRLYGDRSEKLVLEIQGRLEKDSLRKTYQLLSQIAELTGLDDLSEIRSFLE